MGKEIFANHISDKGLISKTHKNLIQQLNSKKKSNLKMGRRGFPGSTVVKNLPASAGDTGSSPGLGRSHMPRSN